MARHLSLIVLALVGSSGGGCSSGSETPSAMPVDSGAGEDSALAPSSPSFHEVFSEVLEGCGTGNCHIGGSGSSAFVVGGEGQTHQWIVGRASMQCPGLEVVRPGASKESSIFWKVGADWGVHCQGVRMPKELAHQGQRPLSDAQLDLLRRWIDGGARR